ncbi:hypothetical protein M422DRAFT_239056 [Sphaerobolus stellatus SS14]|nr:hypothetical protein M422DRAFT_239056 [Sphaerobolus stellatus SS14]
MSATSFPNVDIVICYSDSDDDQKQIQHDLLLTDEVVLYESFLPAKGKLPRMGRIPKMDYSMLYERHLSSANRHLNILILSTFFYKTYAHDGYLGIKRWTRHLDIFTLDLVIIPVNLTKHWFAIVISNLKGCLSPGGQYQVLGLDSLHWDQTKVRTQIIEWLQAELQTKHQLTLEPPMFNLDLPVLIQDNEFDCGPFLIYNLSRRICSIKVVIDIIQTEPPDSPSLTASTIWEPQYAAAKRAELEVLARNIEEERLKSRLRTQIAVARAHEKALEEARKAARRTERRRKKAEKIVGKLSGSTSTSLDSKLCYDGAQCTITPPILFSCKTNLTHELDAIWDGLFDGKGMPNWDTYFQERYLHLVQEAQADGFGVCTKCVKKRIVAFQQAIMCLDAIITEARTRTYTQNGPRLQKALNFLELPQQSRSWLLRITYADDEFLTMGKDVDGLQQLFVTNIFPYFTRTLTVIRIDWIDTEDQGAHMSTTSGEAIVDTHNTILDTMVPIAAEDSRGTEVNDANATLDGADPTVRKDVAGGRIDEQKEEEEEEEEEEEAAIAAAAGGIYDPPDWDFSPFVKNPRRVVWSLHPNGVKYIASCLSQYEKLEAAQAAYMSHWPTFDYKSLLPPNASKEELTTAKNRVITKIDNKLGRLWSKDLWAREDPMYATVEMKAIKAAKLDRTNPQKFFTARMKLRAKLFKQLSQTDQSLWKAKVKERKDVEPPIEDLIAALPKIFALIGDALATRLGWYVEIRAAGLGLGDIAHYFIEKYRPNKAGVIIDYGIFENSEVYDRCFEDKVAGAFKVELRELSRLASHKPRIPDVDIKRPQIELRVYVQFDEQGNVTSQEADVRVSLTTYMEHTFAMVPAAQSGRHKKPKKPEWDEIARADDVSQWVDVGRLPPPPFELGNPMSMKKGRLYQLATHIIQGELGLIDEEKRFKWLGQLSGSLQRVGPRATTAATTGDNGEEINIDEVSESDEEEEEDTPVPLVEDKKKNNAKAARAAKAAKAKEAKAPKRKRVIQEEGEGEGEPEAPPKKKTKQSIKKDIKQPSPVKQAPPKQAGKKANTRRAVVMTTANGAKALMSTAADAIDVKEPMTKPAKGEVIKKEKTVGKQERTSVKGTVPKVSVKRRRTKGEESDTEEQAIEDSAIVVSTPSHPFNGDFTKWYHDIVERQRVLDWEVKEGEGIMGEDLMSCILFLEASEVDTGIVLVGHLDTSAPIRTDDEDSDTVGKLWDILMQPMEAMPAPSAYRSIKNWEPIYTSILQRTQGVVDAILEHPTDGRAGRLMVGGPLGIFCTLRGVEFMRRCIAVRDRESPYAPELESTVSRFGLILAQEQFRRWGIRSFEDGCMDEKRRRYKGIKDVYVAWAVWMEALIRSDVTPDNWWGRRLHGELPEIVSATADEAFRRERGFEPTDLLVALDLKNWKRKEVSLQMKTWWMTLDEVKFTNCGVVDKFLCAHALYMTAGVGSQRKMEWCIEAIANTRKWLGKATTILDDSLLNKRDDLFEIKVTSDEARDVAPEITRSEPVVMDDIEGNSSVVVTPEVIVAIRKRKPPADEVTEDPALQKKRTSARLGLKPPSTTGVAIKASPAPKRAAMKKLRTAETVPEHLQPGLFYWAADSTMYRTAPYDFRPTDMPWSGHDHTIPDLEIYHGVYLQAGLFYCAADGIFYRTAIYKSGSADMPQRGCLFHWAADGTFYRTAIYKSRSADTPQRGCLFHWAADGTFYRTGPFKPVDIPRPGLHHGIPCLWIFRGWVGVLFSVARRRQILQDGAIRFLICRAAVARTRPYDSSSADIPGHGESCCIFPIFRGWFASHEIFDLQRVEEICQAQPDEEGLIPWEQIEEGSAGYAR